MSLPREDQRRLSESVFLTAETVTPLRPPKRKKFVGAVKSLPGDVSNESPFTTPNERDNLAVKSHPKALHPIALNQELIAQTQRPQHNQNGSPQHTIGHTHNQENAKKQPLSTKTSYTYSSDSLLRVNGSAGSASSTTPRRALRISSGGGSTLDFRPLSQNGSNVANSRYISTSVPDLLDDHTNSPSSVTHANGDVYPPNAIKPRGLASSSDDLFEGTPTNTRSSSRSTGQHSDVSGISNGTAAWSRSSEPPQVS